MRDDRDAITKAVEHALKNYQLRNMVYDEHPDAPYRLVDLLTPTGEKNIASGEEELARMADFISNTLSAIQQEPAREEAKPKRLPKSAQEHFFARHRSPPAREEADLQKRFDKLKEAYDRLRRRPIQLTTGCTEEAEALVKRLRNPHFWFSPDGVQGDEGYDEVPLIAAAFIARHHLGEQS